VEGTPALSDSRLDGVEHLVVRHRPVRSLEEAAELRGVTPSAVVKTMVVRRGDSDFLFVLVPGDRVISWAKLRRLLGVSRMSMPAAEIARDVTGYARGTITPLGSSRPWPVIVDTRAATGTVSIGGGAHGVSITIDGAELARILEAQVADVTDPAD
jgi:Cys-tRNA(Pro) deacylase